MDNKYSHLVVDYNEFKQKIVTFIYYANETLLVKPENEEGFSKLDILEKNWRQEIINYLADAFADKSNDFLDGFFDARQPKFHFNVPNPKPVPLNVRVITKQKDIELQISYLYYMLHIIGYCDVIINNTAELDDRRRFTIKDKMDFILNLLNNLNNGEKWPVELLLVGNGIKLKSHNEAREICNLLESNGYIDTIKSTSSEIYASITVQGTLYVEENIQSIKIESSVTKTDIKDFKRIFIVHGHNTEMKETVARVVEKSGFQAVILHEMPNQGRTVIEKFTDYSDVQFAIVLLSADDYGHPKNSPDKTQLRPRQNVVFELGYFIGKLGRERVLALYETFDNFELHSDFNGVVLQKFDKEGGWKIALGKELQSLGVNIDWNALMS